eukprot:m51a1_g10641 hypothetical protein (969) ;mRNA; f:15887-19425
MSSTDAADQQQQPTPQSPRGGAEVPAELVVSVPRSSSRILSPRSGAQSPPSDLTLRARDAEIERLRFEVDSAKRSARAAEKAAVQTEESLRAELRVEREARKRAEAAAERAKEARADADAERTRERKALEDEAARSLAALHAAEQKLAAATASSSKDQQRLEELARALEKREKEAEAMRLASEEQMHKVRQLENASAAKEAALKERDEELARLRVDVSSLRNGSSTHAQAAQEIEASLRADVKRERDARERAVAARDELRQQVASLTEQLGARDARIKQMSTEAKEASALAKDLREAVEKEREGAQQARAAHERRAQEQIDAESKDFAQRERAIRDQSIANIARLEGELAAVTRARDREVESLRGELESLRRDAAAKEAEGARRFSEMEERAGQQLAAERAEKERALAECARLEGQISAVATAQARDAEQRRAELQQKEALASRLQEDLSRAREEAVHVRSNSELRMREKEQIDAESKDFAQRERAIRDQSIANIARLEGELAAVTRARDREVESLRGELESLRRDAAAKEAEGARRFSEMEERAGQQLAAERAEKERALAECARLEGQISAVATAQARDAEQRRAELQQKEALASRLQEDLSRAREEAVHVRSNSELRMREKVAAAEADLRVLEQERRAKEELGARLQCVMARVNAENDALVAAVLTAARSTGPESAASLLASRFAEFNGFATADEQLLSELYRGLQGAVHASSEFSSLASWSQALFSLVKLSSAALARPLGPAPVAEPTAQDEDECKTPPLLFLLRLRKLLHKIFSAAVALKQKELDAVVIHWFFESAPQSPRRAAGGAQERSKASISSVLSSMLLAVQKESFSTELSRQFFDEIVRIIDSTALNLLLTRRDLCTCGNGISMKMGVAAIDEWFQNRPHISESREHMAAAREAANLLIIEKSILKDEDATTKTFPTLSPSNILSIMVNFHSDQFSPSPIDAETILTLKQRAKTQSSP